MYRSTFLQIFNACKRLIYEANCHIFLLLCYSNASYINCKRNKKNNVYKFQMNKVTVDTKQNIIFMS